MTYTPHTFNLPEIPGISKAQLEVHLGLYQGYVKHLNILETELAALAGSADHTYALGELRKRRGFEWNGMRLHELYFEQLEDGPAVLTADTKLYAHLVKQYGDFARFIEAFKAVSGRGPGWAVLAYDPTTKHFSEVWVEDHQVGQLAGIPIILAVDHWEHAYMVDYTPAKKMSYLDAYFSALNFAKVAPRFDRFA